MNPDHEAPQAELKRAQLLQAAEICRELIGKTLTKPRITASDVECACGHGREMMFQLSKLKLSLLGIEPD